MNWDNLRYFLAVVREGSVSGAAVRLGVSHTTVSRRMDALEQELECRVFDRTPEGYSLTQAGEEMVDDAVSVEELAHGIDRRVHGRDAQLSGPLRVTMPDDFANAVLIPRLAEFTDAYPGIELELLTTHTILNLSARAAEIAVRLTTNPPEDLIARRLSFLRLGIYAHPEYLAPAGREIRVILFPGDPDPSWASRHFPEAPVALMADSAATVAAALRAQMGVALLPCFYGDADPALRRLRVDIEETNWSVWLLNHPDLRTTARVRACREFLERTIVGQRSLILGENSRYAELVR